MKTLILISSKNHGVTAATLSGSLFLNKRQVPNYREVVGCIRDTETGLGFFYCLKSWSIE